MRSYQLLFASLALPFASVASAQAQAPAAAPPSSEAAADAAAVDAVIKHQIEAITAADKSQANPADIARMQGDWAPRGAILDAFPPNYFEGSDVAEQWYRGLVALFPVVGFTAMQMKIDEVLDKRIASGFAYVATAAEIDITGPGKAYHVVGTMTFTLAKQGGAWKITGWSWGGRPGVMTVTGK